MVTTTNLIRHYCRNTKGKDYITGDIHGRFDLLEEQLVEIGFDVRVDRLFCTGDLVDRNVKSVEALKWLRTGFFRSVMGNHDERVVRYQTANLERWYDHCGGEWHRDLTLMQKEEFARIFSELPTVIEIETSKGMVGIIHADCPVDDWAKLNHALTSPDLSMQLKKNAINCCRWSRHRFNGADVRPIENIDYVFFGHSTVLTQVTRGNCIYIDTASKGLSDRFTFVDLSNF